MDPLMQNYHYHCAINCLLYSVQYNLAHLLVFRSKRSISRSLTVILCSTLVWITLGLFSCLCGTFLSQLVSTTIGAVPVFILLKVIIFLKLFNDFFVFASVDWFQYKLTAPIITLPWSQYHILSPRRGVRMFFLMFYRLELLCASEHFTALALYVIRKW